MKNSRFPTLSILGAGLFALSSTANGAAVFTFVNDSSGLDGNGPGGSQTENDAIASVDVTLTTIDVIGLNGSSALGDSAENNRTSIPNSANLVINSGDNGAIGGTESTEWNTNEAWIFSSNIAISLDEITFEDFDAGAEFTITSSTSGFTSIVLSGQDTSGVFDLGGAVVPVGESIRFELTGSPDVGSSNLGITSIEVSAVPEPGSTVLLGLGGLAMVLRRRR